MTPKQAAKLADLTSGGVVAWALVYRDGGVGVIQGDRGHAEHAAGTHGGILVPLVAVESGVRTGVAPGTTTPSQASNL
jgi:hypothetical protein